MKNEGLYSETEFQELDKYQRLDWEWVLKKVGTVLDPANEQIQKNARDELVMRFMQAIIEKNKLAGRKMSEDDSQESYFLANEFVDDLLLGLQVIENLDKNGRTNLNIKLGRLASRAPANSDEDILPINEVGSAGVAPSVEDTIFEKYDKDVFYDVFDGLPSQIWRILDESYGIDTPEKNTGELAKELGISRTALRYRVEKALPWIALKLRSANFRESDPLSPEEKYRLKNRDKYEEAQPESKRVAKAQETRDIIAAERAARVAKAAEENEARAAKVREEAHSTNEMNTPEATPQNESRRSLFSKLKRLLR